MKVTTVDLPVRTFVEKSDVTLAEGDLVTLHTDGTLKLATAGSVIGIMQSRLSLTSKDVSAIIFARTARVVQDSAIPVGSRVQQKSSVLNKVETAAGGTVIGTKIQPAVDGAQGDVIEIILDGGSAVKGDVLVAQTATHGNANGAVAALNSTAVNPTKSDFDGLLAATETIADDLRSLRAALIAMGLPLTEV